MPPNLIEDIASVGGGSLSGSDGGRMTPLLESPQSSERRSTFGGPGGLFADDESDSTIPPYSLAYHPKTLRSFRVLVPALILLTHGLFIWGQTTPMWYLYFSVDVNVTMEAQTFETQQIYLLSGMDNPIHAQTQWNTTVSHFDYWDAVQTLWKAEGIDNKWTTRVGAIVLVLFSGVWPHLKLVLLHSFWWLPSHKHTRTGSLYWLGAFGKWSLADVFVVCMLIAVLNLDLQFDSEFLSQRLQTEMPQLVQILDSTATEAEAQTAICENILRLQCSEVLVDWECNLCRYAVGYLHENPGDTVSMINSLLGGIAMNGGGVAALRVAGLFGIYVYCVAVVSSLLLSTLVDTIDHKLKGHPDDVDQLQPNYDDSFMPHLGDDLDPLRSSATWQAHDRNQNRHESHLQLAELTPVHLGGDDPACNEVVEDDDNDLEISQVRFPPTTRERTWSDDDGYEVDQAFLYATFPTSAAALQTPTDRLLVTNHQRQRVFTYLKNICSREQFAVIVLLSLLVIPFVLLAIWSPILNRVTKGSVPILVNNTVGATFDRSYSIVTLSHVLADRGGLDYFLQAVFAMFCIIGPIFRSALLAWQLVMKGTMRVHKKSLFFLNVLGAVNGWDVLLLAVILINTEMPSITQTILDKNSAVCRALAQSGFPDFCLEVDLEFRSEFWYVLIAGVMLSGLCSLVVKLLFIAIDPYGDGDRGGPYFPKSICRRITRCCSHQHEFVE